MIHNNKAYGGFSVDDIEKAKQFYTQVLGFEIVENPMGLELKAGNGVFVYQKDDHQPAAYTVLNIPSDDVDVAVDDLSSKGVTFEHYQGMTDEKGIARGMDHDMGPNIAWFKDPAGNILSVLKSS